MRLLSNKVPTQHHALLSALISPQRLRVYTREGGVCSRTHKQTLFRRPGVQRPIPMCPTWTLSAPTIEFRGRRTCEIYENESMRAGRIWLQKSSLCLSGRWKFAALPQCVHHSSSRRLLIAEGRCTVHTFAYKGGKRIPHDTDQFWRPILILKFEQVTNSPGKLG